MSVMSKLLQSPHIRKFAEYLYNLTHDTPIDPAPPTPAQHAQSFERVRVNVKYTILDDIPVESVNKLLRFLPNHWALEYVPPESVSLTTVTNDPTNPWYNFPFSVGDHTLLFVNGQTRNLKYAGGCTSNYRATVTLNEWEYNRPFEMGLRVFHELCHAESLPADDMLKNNVFTSWLHPDIREHWNANKSKYAHDAFWQMLYYEYLLHYKVINLP